jgi:hypothetical protein
MKLPSELFHGPVFNAQAEYKRVKDLYDAHPLKADDERACQQYTLKLMSKAIEEFPESPSEAFLQRMYSAIVELYKLEYLFASSPLEPHFDDKYYSEYLTRTVHRYSPGRLPQANEFVLHLFRELIRRAPKTLFADVDDPDSGTPLIQLIRTPNEFIDAVFSFAEHAEHEKTRLFEELNTQLWMNALSASGLTRGDAGTEKIKKLKFPWESDLPPLARCTAYLRDTPFLDLILMPLPFEIPIETRFQHHWIVAPPGAGKSTTLQHFILRDLELVAANKASIVVMESNRDLIKAIEGLKEFAPGERLDGKLVVIDAEDIECPVALNLFDVGLDDQTSSPADREAFRNAVLAQYEYIFSALLSAEFTSRQNTLFTFTLELLLAIPGATLDTLVDLIGLHPVWLTPA